MANNTLLASDSFVSGSLAAGWTALTGFSACQVVAGSPNVIEANATSTEAAQIWTGLTPSADHSSEVTINALTATGVNIAVLYIRMQPGAVCSGYQANIQNNGGTITCYIFVTTAGSPVQKAFKVISAVAVGDVFTFQAAGACLSLYQNGTQVMFWYDTTFTSGTFGCGAYATVAITNCKISAWRGYNAVQQDGIWQKQGVIIPALTADLAGGAELGPQNISIIGPEAGELLTGQSVWKGYFAAGNSGTSVGYAESPVADGINWTRGANVITGIGICVAAIKVGATYHVYAQAVGGQAVQHYTSSASSSGWSLQSNNVFNVATTLYFSPVAIIAGTWYALYTTGTLAFPLVTNLATSADGIAWTPYGSNPVASNFWGVVRATKIGSTYYVWGQTVNPAQRQATKPGIDPGEGIRMQTTDFHTFTNPVKSIHYSQMFEGLNEPNGGAFCSFPLDVNGKALLYYSAGPDDAIATASSILQICVATGPAAIADIVTGNEDAVTQVAADTFQRADGALGANWTTPTGGTAFQIASHFAEPTTTGALNHAVYTGASFNADQYSEVTLKTLAASSFADPIVRASTAALTFYQANIGGPTGSAFTAGIYKRVAGTPTLISPTQSCTVNANDVFRLMVTTASDGFPILSLYQNGYLILQIEDYSNAIASGNPGMVANAASAVTNAQFSAWAGGNANTLFAISGSAGVAGATVTYAGPFNGTVTADGSGNYSVPSLLPGAYTITPSKAGKVFTPTNSAQTVSTAAITGVNFTAADIPATASQGPGFGINNGVVQFIGPGVH